MKFRNPFRNPFRKPPPSPSEEVAKVAKQVVIEILKNSDTRFVMAGKTYKITAVDIRSLAIEPVK